MILLTKTQNRRRIPPSFYSCHDDGVGYALLVARYGSTYLGVGQDTVAVEQDRLELAGRGEAGGLPHVAAAAEGRTVLVVATGEKATQRPAASMKGRSSSGNEDAMLLEDCTIERMIRFRKGPALLTFVLLTDEDSTGLTLASGAHLTELQYRRLVPSFHTSTRTHGHTDKGDRGSREEGTGPASRWSTGRGQEFGATSSSPVFTRYTLGTAKWR